MLSKCLDVQGGTEELIQNNLNDEIIHKSKYVPAKIKSHKNEIRTNFHNERMPS